MLQQGRGLSAIASSLLFLPLTGLISIGSICAAPLAQRLGRPAVPRHRAGRPDRHVPGRGVGQSPQPSLWPLALALVPAGFSSGLLVPTMASQSIAAVEPALHGAASAVFSTSRQIGAAIGVATFAPLLGGDAQPPGRFHPVPDRRRRRHRGRAVCSP